MNRLSEIEKQRINNIRRNKKLLKKLNLDTIAQSLNDEILQKKSRVGRKHKSLSNKVNGEVINNEPTRKSRRLAINKNDNEETEDMLKLKQIENLKIQNEIIKVKETWLYGNVKVSDLIYDKSGEKGIDYEEELQKMIQDVGQRFSTGDFFEIIRKRKELLSKEVEEIRSRFDGIQLIKKKGEETINDIKLVNSRITSITFLESKEDRVVIAGDTNGNVGLWRTDLCDGKEKSIKYSFSPHRKSILKILSIKQFPEKIFSCSYDCKIESLDLEKLSFSTLVKFDNIETMKTLFAGISDINTCRNGNPNVFYMLTLSGTFYQLDIREPINTLDDKRLLKLHDKKIGAFAINPVVSYQIATTSLDKSLKLWDLRNVPNANNRLTLPYYGSYYSKHSISCVDWNQTHRIVCNGYDDTINLFNLTNMSDSNLLTEESNKKITGPESDNTAIIPYLKIKHNCQTGRWVTIFKSKWQSDPEDGIQKFVIPNMNKGVDVYSQDGDILTHLSDSINVVPAALAFHSSKNWIVGGSANGKVYLFE